MSIPAVRAQVVRKLVRRDFHLARRAILVSLLGTVVASVLACGTSPSGRSAGASMLAIVTIGLAFHIPLVLVFGDRERGTLAFTLSLPVTPAEHAIARLASCTLLFLLPLAAAALVIAVEAWRRGGHAPWVASHAIPGALLLLLLGFAAVLAVAIASESQGATIGFLAALLLVLGNLHLYAHSLQLPLARLLAAYLEGGAFFALTIGVELVSLGTVVVAVALVSVSKRSYV